MKYATKGTPRVEFTILLRELMIKLQDNPNFQWPLELFRPS